MEAIEVVEKIRAKVLSHIKTEPFTPFNSDYNDFEKVHCVMGVVLQDIDSVKVEVEGLK